MSATIWTEEWSHLDPAEVPELRIGPLSPAGAEQARLLTERRLLKIQELRSGLAISTRSYVGTVRIDDLTLHIRPKIGADTLPTFMRYALGLTAVTRQMPANSPTVKGGFLDLLGLLFLEELDQILRSGVLQDYRPAEAWLSTPRGQLRFSELARHPFRAGVTLPCRFAERTANLALNQALATTAGVLSRAVSDRTLQFELHAREAMLSEVCDRFPLSRALLDRARGTQDRRSTYYEPALRLAELVLEGRGPAFEEGERASLEGFLFNMDLLFERFVARLCREFSPPDWQSDAQVNSRSAYHYHANPFGWTLPRLRPDLVVRDSSGMPCLVIDTKYKLLAGQPPSSDDLYQLTLYSLSFGQSHSIPARIIYPALGEPGKEPILYFYGFQQAGPLASISLQGLNLQTCAAALRSNDTDSLRQTARSCLTTTSGAVKQLKQ